MDVQTIGIVVAGAVLVAVVLYIWDRRTKHQTIDVLDAAKLALGSGAVAGGVAYAVTGDALPVVADVVSEAIPAVQDMFVGKPGF